jgi:RNA 2',3'-cyclic 3'-phosphodiesterase
VDPRYHYFFAVKLPKEAKQFLKRWVEMNKEQYPFKRWVHYEDYHITLAFLGFAEQSMLKQIIMQVHETLTGVDPFKLTIDQLGTFGKKTNPRIFWAGVHHSDSLCSIQKKVYNQCIRTGFELDRKPFRPHITLARKWNGEEPFNDKTLTSITIEGNSLTFQVEEIVLYETHLNQIPKYHEFYCFSLK